MSKLKNLFGELVLPAPRKWSLRPEVLLSVNIPKPMHGTAPRAVLGQSWWDKERKAAYKSTDFHCVACGVAKHKARNRQWLEGHELYEVDYVKGTMKYLETIPLCHFCHNFIHSGRMKALLDSGKLHQAKYAAIVQHGDRVLAAAGLKRLTPYEGSFAGWSSWRLVIGRKKYKGLFKNEAEWVEYHKEKNDEH